MLKFVVRSLGSLDDAGCNFTAHLVWFALAHTRGAPRVQLFALADLHAENEIVDGELQISSESVRLTSPQTGPPLFHLLIYLLIYLRYVCNITKQKQNKTKQKGYDHCCALSAIGLAFRRMYVFGPVERVFLAKAPIDTAQALFGDAVKLRKDWPEFVDKEEVQVFPPLAREVLARRLPSKLLAGLKSFSAGRCKSGRKGTDRVSRKAPAVRKDSEGPPEESSGSSDSDGDGSEHSDISRDSLDSILEDANRRPVPPPPPDDGGHQSHESRKIVFGPWTYSAIVSKGQLRGFGGNCGCHFGSRLTCKKAFTILKEDGHLPEEERIGKCSRLAKQWLLLGRDIPVGALQGRQRHVGVQREDVALRPEAELDAEAARLD